MFASELPRKGTSSYGRLVHYLANPQADGRSVGRPAERVLQVRGTHLLNTQLDDPEVLADAITEVTVVQARNTRAKEKTLHLLLSFRETLDLQTLSAIEDRFVELLGYGQHQRISVVHGDTDHQHIHLAINKVYRSTDRRGRTVYLNRHLGCGWSRMATIASRVEREFGLLVDPHRVRHTQAKLAPHAGPAAQGDLVAQLRAGWTRAMDAARSWEEARRIAADHGVELRTTGKTGLRLVAGDGTAVAASRVGKRYGRASLEQRFGPYPASPASGRGEPKVRRSAATPLVTRIRRALGTELRAATSWAEVHELAEQHGWRLVRRGGGLAFEDVSTGELTTASSVSNRLSLGRATKRLGPYAPSTGQSQWFELREAVVERAASQTEQDHRRRRRAIKAATPPGPSRGRWLEHSRILLRRDARQVHQLHELGLQLERATPADWPRIAQVDPSLMAVFRGYALAIHQALPRLAPRAQKQLLQSLPTPGQPARRSAFQETPSTDRTLVRPVPSAKPAQRSLIAVVRDQALRHRSVQDTEHRSRHHYERTHHASLLDRRTPAPAIEPQGNPVQPLPARSLVRPA